MQELFKGYIKTKDKVPQTKFKNKDKLLTLSEVEDLEEYAGLLNSNVILIDVDEYNSSERLMNIVEDLQLNCRVYETTRGKHFIFYGGNINKCGTHLKLAVGIEADIKVGNHNSISVLKYKGAERKIIYDIEPDESYEPAPVWLTPVKTKTDFTSLESGEGRNQELFNYILSLQRAELSNEQIKDTIKLLNKYVLPDPLDEEELNKILRDDSFKKPVFFTDKGFRHEIMARYMINAYHIIRFSGNLHIYNNGVYEAGKSAIMEKMIELVDNIKINQKREVMSYIEAKAPLVRTMADARYIAFNNGVYDIVSGKLEDFRPDLVITNKIPYDYNYNAYNEDMDGMLDRISCHDDQIRDLLEEMAGYCMYRRNELRKAFILTGDKSNGKSTYLDCIAYMLGESSTSALDLKELGDRFRTAELFGKLVNIGDDIGDEFIPNPAVFKKLVSGDRVTVERKGCDPFEFNNYSKLLFSANNIPRIKDKTGAVLDRLIIIPFNANFSKNDPDYDPYIKYKLRTDEAMEYLIQIALDGLKRVLANNGFTICEKVQAELDEYSEKNNPVMAFLKDVDIEVDIINQTVKEVYTQYKIYCGDNGYTPLAINAFGQILKKDYDIISVQKRIDKRNVRIYRRRVD